MFTMDVSIVVGFYVRVNERSVLPYTIRNKIF